MEMVYLNRRPAGASTAARCLQTHPENPGEYGLRARRYDDRHLHLRSPVVKRSIVVCGHKTSVSLEEPFWTSMKDIAAQRGTVLSALVSEIENNRQQGNLSSAIRLFVLVPTFLGS